MVFETEVIKADVVVGGGPAGGAAIRAADGVKDVVRR
jgi:hypothetical protein